MMGSSSKHLKQLLNEDQEPFVLHNYIQEKRTQLNKQPLKTKLQLNKTQTQPRNLCKDVCFFSFHDSSNLTKSPLFDFSKKSPYRGSGSNTVFVHIPAKTAALLLEAALRIQSQSENKKSSKNIGFGFFGSILKRIRKRKKQPSERCSETEIKVSVKDILRWEPSDVCTVERAEEEEIDLGLEERRVSDVGLCCSRVSSAWSESNEEKSLDLETSTSSCSEETEQGRESKIGEEEGPEFNLCEKRSPLRLILESGSSPRRRSPELVSPATSPNRRKHQVVEKEEDHLSSVGKEEKEEKEHCSPVSVLDIQLEDEVEEQDDDEEEEDYDDSELERSFAFVQKAKRKLLQKLRRFELLAELDPLELEKRIAEDYNDDEDDDDEDDSDNGEDDKDDDDSLLQEENCSNHMTVPLDMKRLVIDLMRGEGAVAETSHRALVTNERCMRMGSLKNVERRTINGMVEMDFKGERNEWQKNTELVEETVMEVELAIFSFLVEEFSVELVHFSDIF